MNNIVFDFTQASQAKVLLKNQPTALMPAVLAQKLLRMYAKELTKAKVEDIIEEHIHHLMIAKDNGDLKRAIEASLTFVAERELIKNIADEQWDAYAVNPVKPETEQREESLASVILASD
jgi:hypothetical protein